MPRAYFELKAVALLDSIRNRSLRSTAEREARRILRTANWALPPSRIRRLMWPWFAQVIILGVLVVLVWVFAIPPRDLDWGKLSHVLELLVALPASFVGAIIPFLVLIVEFLNQSQRTVIRREYQLRSALTAIIPSILLLLGIVAMDAIIQFGVGDAVIQWGVAVLSLLLISSVLLGIAFVVRAIRMVSPHYYFRAIRDELLQQAYRSLLEEASYRVANGILQRTYAESQVLNLPFSRLNARECFAPSSGTVTDVNIGRLASILRQLGETAYSSRSGEYRGVVCFSFGSKVHKDEVLAYLSRDEKDGEILATDLVRAIRIGRSGQSANTRLREIFDEYRQMVLQAVDIGDAAQFRRCMEVYAAMLKSYMQTGIRFSEEYVGDFLSRWGAIRMLQGEMEDIARRACQSKDDEFLATVLHEYRTLLTEAFEQRDLLVFNTLLELFPYSYWFASKTGNRLGKDRSYRFLQEFCDWTLLREMERIGDEGVNLLPFLKLVRETLERLLRATVDAQDVESFGEMLDGLATLFQYFDTTERATRARRGGGAREDEVYTFMQGHAEHMTRLVYRAYAYVIQLRQVRRIAPSVASEVVAQLQRHMEDGRELAIWADRAADDDRDGWEYREMTRGVTATDPGERPRWVLVLRGFALQVGREHPVDLGPSSLAKHDRDVILGLIRRVYEQREEWRWIVGVIDERDRGHLAAAIDRAAEEYDRAVEEGVIRAELSAQRIEAFRKTVRDKYGEGGLIRWLLEERGKAVPRELGPEDSFGYRHRGPKEAFIDQDRVSYIMWGEQYGSGMAESENIAILRKLRESARRVEAADGSVRVLIDCGMEELRRGGRTATLVVVAHDVALRQELHGMEGFTPAWQLGESGRRAIGTYAGALIIGSDEIEEGGALVVDIDSACHLEESMGEPSVDVRQLTPEEVQALSAGEGGVPERKLLQEVLVTVGKRFRVVIDSDEAAVLIVRKP